MRTIISSEYGRSHPEERNRRPENLTSRTSLTFVGIEFQVTPRMIQETTFTMWKTLALGLVLSLVFKRFSSDFHLDDGEGET